MKPFKILFFIVILISCKKEIIRPKFTSEQLQWIQNVQNPQYRVVTQKNGNITSIDTIETLTDTEIVQKIDKSRGEFTLKAEYLHYDEGYYTVSFVNFYNFMDTLYVTITNKYWNNFSVIVQKMGYIVGGGGYTGGLPVPDTVDINGTVYNGVYKLTKSRKYYNYYNGYKIDFKKGIGFLYLEKDSIGDTDTLIYIATMIQ